MVTKQNFPNHIEDEATRWIIERDAGLSSAEEGALHRWLASDPLNAQAFARAEQVWAAMGSAPVRAELARRDNVVSIDPQLPAKQATWRSPRRLLPAMAATLALAFLGFVNDWPTRLRADAVTGTGEQHELKLADGSTIRLNTDSAVTVEYEADRRLVRLLKGEAAFTVAPDRNRPFTVEAGTGATTALGTQFIIRREGKQTHVAVTEHRVRVQTSFDGARRKADISEGQAIDYGQGTLTKPYAIDVYSSGAWMRQRLVFVDRPLSEVVSELGRYHEGYLGLVGSTLGKRRVSGIFRTDDPLGAVDNLERSLGIESTRITDRLIFLHD